MQPPDLERLRGLLPAGQPAALAARLIGQARPNPPGDELRACVFLKKLLEPWGFEVWVEFSPQGNRPSLGARMRWRRGPTLLLVGHLDVVPVGDPTAWSHDPHRGVVASGILHGRGAVDMLGGVAAMVWGARLAQLAGWPLAGAVELHLLADEEAGGGEGAAWLAKRGLLRGKAAVVGEPTNLNLVIAQKGALWSALTIKGRSAHGSVPHLGINAAAAAASLVPSLLALEPPGRHPLLGPGTVNLGLIQGGQRVNQVPGTCRLELDMRLVPGCDPQEMEARIDALGQDLARRERVEYSRQRLLWAQPFATNPRRAIVKLAQQALEAVNGRPPGPPRGGRGFSDGRFYALDAGIPTVVLGPGHMARAHAADEQVAVTDLERAALVYAWLIRAFLGPK